MKKNKFSAFFKRAEKFQPFSNFSLRNFPYTQKIELDDFLRECDLMAK